MRIEETRIAGVQLIEPEAVHDERGWFVRTYCARAFEEHGLSTKLVQCGAAYNRLAGTLRGLHYQAAPHAEAKLVRVTRGRLFDVVVDLRANSPTCYQWVAMELSVANRLMLYVPEGCAHGYLTLEADTEVAYQMSSAYEPRAARGVRYNDPLLAIIWPRGVRVISERDRNWPLLSIKRVA